MESVPTGTQEDAPDSEAAQKFIAQMSAAGASVVTPDGATVRPKGRTVQGVDVPVSSLSAARRSTAPDRKVPLRTVIELDVEEQDERILVLKRPSGEEIELRIPPVKTEVGFRGGRLQNQIEKRWREMNATASDQEAERLEKEIIQLQEKQVRLLIPNIPEGLLKTLGMRVLQQILDQTALLVAEAMGQTADPLRYIRHIYRLIDQPHGEGDEGLLVFLKEKFADIEEMYGKSSLPKR